MGGLYLVCIEQEYSIAAEYLSGDKSNHIPSLHIPQLYYFIAFSTFFGWPVLISGPGGAPSLFRGVWSRMLGTKLYVSSHLILDRAYLAKS